MAEREWTPDQKNAIEARGGTLLVSAAAGSGKTAVLVERVVQRLLDPINGCDADRLLVVTFTKAAAAEMRERISAALSARLAARPDDARLLRQQMLLPCAAICTIDSFCNDLVRENFHRLDLAPDYKILDAGELTLLRSEAMDIAMEEFYQKGDPAFTELLELVRKGRDDAELTETVSRLYDYTQAYPFPEEWIQHARALCRADLPEQENPWMAEIRAYLAQALAFAQHTAQSARALLETEPALCEKYAQASGGSVTLTEDVEVGTKDADVIYTDEDKVTTDLSEHFQPHLKPDFNLDLLRSNNYICHFLVVRRSVVQKAGGFRREFDGAQDYDFIFRCVEQAREVIHVPEILYHWRTHKSSTADNPASKMYAFEAGKRAIEGNLERTGTPGTVEHTPDFGFYRVKYPVQGEPLVSIIIPNREEKETLQACVESIFEKTVYKNYEIIIVENNSSSDEIFRYYRKLSEDPRIHLLRWKKEFNYSAINNFGVRHAKGDYLLFLNNDVKVIDPDWLSEMLGVCQRQEVGAVGAKLIYPDNTIQHAGCVVGMGGIAGHMFVNMPAERTGYLHKASLLQDMSCVTAACMMMKKNVFLEAGGFTEELAVAFNDVDLCLKVRSHGHLIVYDPYVKLYHYESKSRGAEDSEEKVRRFQSEIEYIRSHWIDILKNGDPYYNKNLSLSKWNYSLKPLPGMGKKKG